MNLTIHDLCELLDVSEKTIHQWVKESKIPAYKIGQHFRFNKSEIQNWIIRNNIKTSNKIMDSDNPNSSVCLSEILMHGGIYYDIQGDTIFELIRNIVQVIPTPPETTKEIITYQLIEREELMPTCVGNGIAIPHPRNPVITDVDNESLSICLLKNPLNYSSLDNLPVHSMFILLSANPKRHLEILSKISFLCKQEEFVQLLRKKAKKDEILNYIIEQENQWKVKE